MKYIRKILPVVLAMQLILMTGCGNLVSKNNSSEPKHNDHTSNVIEGDVTSHDEGFTQEPEQLQEPEKAQEITTASDESNIHECSIIMVGDILLHDRVAKSGQKEDGSYDFTSIFAHTKDQIQEADLALVNEEVIIGGEELGVTGYPAFNAPFELGDALVDTGFDVVLHATNHALDKGKKGVLNCINFWSTNYPEVGVIGIYESEDESRKIYIQDVNGIKIAILNYTYGTNGIPLPDGMPYAVSMMDTDRVLADIEEAEEEADFTIVCPHWGTEYRLTPDQGQEKLAQQMAEKGADLILGTHPHVLEPMTWIDHTLVYYSLGNFVNWTSGEGEGTSNRMVGGMAKVIIEMDDGDEEAHIAAYDLKPLVSHVESGYGNVTVYPLDQYSEELADKNEIRLQDSSFSYEYCQKLVQEINEE